MRYLLILSCLCAVSSGATLVVGVGGDYGTIQPAIDAAAEGDTVLVKPGEYVITVPITFRGKAITLRGEAGADATVIRMAATPADPDRGSVVVFESGETEAALLEGFTLTGGRGTLVGESGRNGGGVCCHSASPMLTNCKISGNSARGNGGGVYCHGSSATLTNCTISGNWALLNGGGVYLLNSSATLTGCTIPGNTTDGKAGGIYCEGASPTLTGCTILENGYGGVHCVRSSPSLMNCMISGNWGAVQGGGVSCREGSSPTLTDCTISENWGGVGGGVYCGSGASPTLTNCTIAGNWTSAEGEGGGVYSGENSFPTLTGCTISGNLDRGVYCWYSSPTLTNCTISGNSDGGVWCASSSLTLTNCTISGNWARTGAGGIYCSASASASPTVTNCIVWGNAGGSWVVFGELSAPDVSFSCLETEEVWPGAGNINTDPLFCGFAGPADAFVDAASPEGGDGTAARPFRNLAAALEFSLSLKANSPCMRTGKGGVNIGADLGTCEGGEATERVLHVAGGKYSIEGSSLSQGVSILGAGADKTVLLGTVWGLRTGATMSGVRVTGGTVGGVVIGDGEKPALSDCTISCNPAPGYSGYGVCCEGSCSPTLTNCTISNTSLGVYCAWGCSPTLTNCWISGNSGGVQSKKSSPNFTNCTISRNSGGGVRCAIEDSARFVSCTISGNSGGVSCDSGSVATFSGCMISGNSGSGVYCYESSPSITDCRISGNNTTYAGVHCLWSSPRLTNCTISGNKGDWGGGVYCGWGSFPTLTNCTISGNSGGGVYCYESSPTLTNCLVWGNTPESVCGARSHCLTDCDPLFVHNGVFNFARTISVVIQGTTYSLPNFIVGPPDYHLQPGSPAIDAGTCDGAPATDIEGTARPQGAGCDIGAYEYAATAVVAFARGDGNRDGLLDIADAVFVLQYLFGGGGGGELGCGDALDGNDDGKLDIADAIAVLQHLFAQAGPLAAPFGACGADPTADGLDCASYPPCE